jgi:tetratricopeptide (TPR) repeat protein
MAIMKDLEASNKLALAAADKPAEVLNNLAIFYMMKGGDSLKTATDLFISTEKVIRQSKHTSHKSFSTILNNLAIFYYNQKMPVSKKLTEELHQLTRREQNRKPLYLINIAAINYKTGEYDSALKVLEGLKLLVESEEGIHFFDLDNLKRIFLLSALNNVRLKRLQEFEKDMNSYKSLLPSAEEDPVSYSKAERMHAIALIKFGLIDRAKQILENC